MLIISCPALRGEHQNPRGGSKLSSFATLVSAADVDIADQVADEITAW
jgi:hypothetical protein